jgi:hypothetical protein
MAFLHEIGLHQMLPFALSLSKGELLQHADFICRPVHGSTSSPRTEGSFRNL